MPGEGTVGAINRRRLCALVSDHSASGLDVPELIKYYLHLKIIHGLLDQLMVRLSVPNEPTKGYSI